MFPGSHQRTENLWNPTSGFFFAKSNGTVQRFASVNTVFIILAVKMFFFYKDIVTERWVEKMSGEKMPNII